MKIDEKTYGRMEAMIKMRRCVDAINRAMADDQPPAARDIDLLRQYANEYRSLEEKT